MNTFSIIILAAIAVDLALDIASSVLNLRSLRLTPPPGLEDVYPEQEYRRSQEYLRTTTRFGFVSGTYRLALLLAFWFSGGFNYLDQAVRGLDYGPIPSGIIYLAALGLAYSLLTLPFSIYATFVIEGRYGFNKTTPGLYIADRLKGLALGAILGAPLTAGVLALFEYAGQNAWLYAWAAIAAFSLAVQFVAPTWIMPLFNKFTPLESGELRDAILRYAESAHFPLKNVYVMDGSKRSTRSNAFFTGFGRNKRVALFDTLIAKHTTPELVSILAHEVGHFKRKHILLGSAVSILHAGFLLFLLSFFLNSTGLYEAFYMETPSVYTGLLFFGMLYTPVETLLSIGMSALSRRHEYQADRFAAETVEEPGSLVVALKKLSAHNLSNLTPHAFYVFLNYSHPPLAERIREIRRRTQEAKASKKRPTES